MKTLKRRKNVPYGCIPGLSYKLLDAGLHKMKQYNILLFFIMVLNFLPTSAANQSITISGKITDAADGSPIPGVNVVIKGQNIGTVTDFNGKYTIQASAGDVIECSFVGYLKEEFEVGEQSVIDVQMIGDITAMEEVVVVGYGTKTKESVVGAITQTDGKTLMQAGGVTNVGEALQGRLPGVTTITGNNQPGETALKIFIRGQSSWNNDGQPLILVDGVPRNMEDIDLNEIDKISVLKDASATAVFGVKGGNGVIMITTKRGKTGKAQLTLSANSTMKMYSKLPKKLESYDAIMVANESIMRELAYRPIVWNDIVPMEIAEKYRNPATLEESYIYPNVDWEDVIIKDRAWDHRVNLTVQGGSDFALYFGSLTYQTTSDILNGAKYNNGKGYTSEYSYDRFNYRSNLDFNVTKTTTFSVNLAGFYGVQVKPYDDITRPISSIYSLGPDVYIPYYPDGYYGIHPSLEWGLTNPLALITTTGYNTNNKFQITSDFELKQDLSFVLEGLSFKGKLSYDNDMISRQSVYDPGFTDNLNTYFRYYDKGSGEEFIVTPEIASTNFDYVVQPWDLRTMQVDDSKRNRRLNYEFSLFYERIFDAKHRFSALALFKREEITRGSIFPRYREDWVGRITYDYDSRYFLDVNGAYNGSEAFGKGYRFDLFPSIALGWMLSNESFMSKLIWLDKLKIRGSYGLVGDDGITDKVIEDDYPRWEYIKQWTSGGNTYLVPSSFSGTSPYVWYSELTVGNPDLQWETSVKSNIGTELAVLQNKISVEFDYFMEDRDNILIFGYDRSVPHFYGIEPANVNTGQVKVKGYELVIDLNHQFSNDISVFAKYSMTNAKDEVIYREDPPLRPDYLKDKGFAIDQPRSAIPGEIMQSWDDVYMSTPIASGQDYRRIGYYDVVDYNSDGVYESSKDNAPYGYPERPQKTWNTSAGVGYKGVNLMVQFYGTQNAARRYTTSSFSAQQYLYYEHRLGYWSKENPGGTKTIDAWTLDQAATEPEKGWFDASIVRLKTVEISYDFPQRVCNKIKVSGLRIFANGNNLYLWTDMPDDREFNDVVEWSGDYPTLKRFNFGLNLKF